MTTMSTDLSKEEKLIADYVFTNLDSISKRYEFFQDPKANSIHS